MNDTVAYDQTGFAGADNMLQYLLYETIFQISDETKQQLMIEKRKNDAARETIRKLLIEQSAMERKQIKAKCMEESLRLGQFKPERHGEHFKDVWSDGYAFEEMQKKLQKITNERNEIMSASSNLRKRKPSASTSALLLIALTFDGFQVNAKCADSSNRPPRA
jgi:hypothetical protein